MSYSPVQTEKLQKYSAAFVLLAICILSITVFLQYLPARDFGFLDWDDTSYIQEDAVVSRGLGKDSLHYAFTTFDNPYFMPLTRLSYMTDVSLYGLDQATGYRFTNVILHTLTSLLLFALIYRATWRLLPAFLTGLIFAIHPQHVEAVVWIAGRKELLAGLFGVVSLLCYQQYAQSTRQGWYLAALLAYGCSLFSKPIWITLPALLLLWDYFILQKITRENGLRCLVEKIPFFVICISYSIFFTYSVQITEEPISYFPEVSWETRWMLPVLAIAKYLVNTFLPAGLVPYYAFPDQVDIVFGVAWTGLLLALLYVFWRIRRQYSGLLLAALWFVIALAPALKITMFPQGEAIFVGDRYAYLPHIGFFAGIVLFFEGFLQRSGNVARIGTGFLAIVALSGLMFVAQQTIASWRTPEILWQATYERNEGKGKAYALGVLASHYEKQKRYVEAIETYKKAHDIYPQQFIYPMMIASLLDTPFRQYEASRLWFNKLLHDSPAPVAILLDIGKHEYQQGNSKEAESFLQVARQRYMAGSGVNKKDLYILLGLAQMSNGKNRQAATTFAQANLLPQEKAELCQRLLQNNLNEFCHDSSGLLKN